MTMLNNYFDILINKIKEEKADIPIAAMIVKDNEIISCKQIIIFAHIGQTLFSIAVVNIH